MRNVEGCQNKILINQIKRCTYLYLQGVLSKHSRSSTYIHRGQECDLQEHFGLKTQNLSLTPHLPRPAEETYTVHTCTRHQGGKQQSQSAIPTAAQSKQRRSIRTYPNNQLLRASQEVYGSTITWINITKHNSEVKTNVKGRAKQHKCCFIVILAKHDTFCPSSGFINHIYCCT